MDIYAIVASVGVAAVTTPILMWLWRSLAPASDSKLHPLSPEIFARNRKLEQSAGYVAAAAAVIFAFLTGFSKPIGLSGVVLLLAVSGTAYVLWILIRLKYSRDQDARAFAAYIESAHKVSARSYAFFMIVFPVTLAVAVLRILILNAA